VGRIISNRDEVRDEIRRRINSGNDFYYAFRKFFYIILSAFKTHGEGAHVFFFQLFCMGVKHDILQCLKTAEENICT
jgi:hypothetical protein